MHFCVFAARLYGRVPVARKTSLNWFMPALVNSSVGSSQGTTLDDGTNVWPCFLTKKSMNCWRISLAVTMFPILFRLGRWRRGLLEIGSLGLQVNVAQCHVMFSGDTGAILVFG